LSILKATSIQDDSLVNHSVFSHTTKFYYDTVKDFITKKTHKN